MLLVMIVMIGLLLLVIGVFYGKLVILCFGFDIFIWLMNVIRVLFVLWGMVMGFVFLLGGVIGVLFSLVGFIVVVFVGVVVFIWKYWDFIRGFFVGVFSGIMERLILLCEIFEWFGFVFDVIGSGISLVFNWFKLLLLLMEFSKEMLDKCISVGEVFGNVFGGVL